MPTRDRKSCVEPPEAKRSELTSLAAIIRHYFLHYQPVHEDELKWFRHQPSLEDALRVAGTAQDENNHRYHHQRRIKARSIAEATKALAESHDHIQSCRSFHDLWNLLRSLLTPIQGIGELYIYDTSLRIGAFLRLAPDKVYLHAGTRTGARSLGLSRRGDSKLWLETEELPALLRKLSTSDVENLLCIYKEQLAHVTRA